MPGPNRSSLIAKMHKVLKQHYKPVASENNRLLLEQMLFACCLENTPYEKAEKTYHHLTTSFFDWNEVRVSTVKELAESMRDVSDPDSAASNLKRILQTVFEANYSFDLEATKKQNIGVGIKRLAKLEGASPFVVAYATQHGLGGHSIPLDRGALDVLYIVGIASEAENAGGAVAGLERAIPKNKGAEFASLLHQFAADFVASPFSPTIKSVLLAISPEAKDRLPKRGQKKEPEPKPAPAAKADAKPLPGKMALKAAAERAAAEKAAARGRGREAEKSPVPKRDLKESAKAKSAAAEVGKKKLSSKKEMPRPAAKAARPPRTATAGSGRSSGHRSASKRLAKRKPR